MPITPEKQTQSAPRVLIITPDNDLSLSLKKPLSVRLTRENITEPPVVTTVIGTASQAKEQLSRRERQDAIIVDITDPESELPLLSDLAKELKQAQEQTRETVIIGLSKQVGRDFEAQRKLGLERGFLVISRPVGAKEIALILSPKSLETAKQNLQISLDRLNAISPPQPGKLE